MHITCNEEPFQSWSGSSRSAILNVIRKKTSHVVDSNSTPMQRVVRFDSKSKKEKDCPQILRHYSWVKNYAHNSHTFEREPQ